MFKRHPIVTVVVAASLLYMLVTAPMTVIDGLGALGVLAGKLLDSIAMAISSAM